MEDLVLRYSIVTGFFKEDRYAVAIHVKMSSHSGRAIVIPSIENQ